MIIYVVKWTIRQCDWWQTRLRMLNFCISWCNLLYLLFFHKAAWPQQKRNSPIFIHLSPFTCISNGQITHASLNWISQVLVGWINLQSHGVDGAKEPSAQHIHHLNPFFAFFFFYPQMQLQAWGGWRLRPGAAQHPQQQLVASKKRSFRQRTSTPHRSLECVSLKQRRNIPAHSASVIPGV